MTDNDSPQYVAGAASVFEDARFVLRTMRAALEFSAAQHHVPAMALLPTFSLATFEARRWLSQHSPDAAAALPADGVDLIQAVRNASKWVDATRGKSTVALAQFQSVATLHATLFLGRARFKWAERFERDLGVYRCGGVDVLNTHTIGMLVGDWANPLVTPTASTAVRDAASTMSLQASALLGSEPPVERSFIQKLAPVTMHDVRSARYYDAAVTDSREGFAGYLQTLRNSLAWTSLMEPSYDDERGAVFKFRFLALYHVVSSMRTLGVAVPAGASRLMSGDAVRVLRNELIHYNPHHDTPLEALQPQSPRAGLVQNAFARSFGEVERELATAIAETHSSLSA